ncbi:MAG: 50S ribosomal protein L15 [Deltaproteobacteria bacterium RIFCSPLOWO2_02_FULL_50_16]|nr:MAG: 50S ribosomal protein L15 [Deltaproteobacteria bacterium GWA2_50_8]OGQ26917.1 MAG: 50S ribosomal protein L15 [Deltaproteobacteria bacterium RIFCSPHIGHO2_02_FULL_50_15]OGQ56179.1 MAG: 50S ribosomal protein L15 [Deltaproteobacteria bacterium RIFCSPLOWO2_02_FULL_50_16]OGQ67036.1 MAG: 50S ribosomal protein L15 [Deltaproteobacteria bacterium RIFCSPLOWO2_12_FULL_50_11]
MINLANLPKVEGQKKKRKRVGRGNSSGHGGTSCRGHKGQKARSGYSQKRGFEGGQMPFIRRIPKRGFKNYFKKEFAICNIGDLKEFKANSVVDWDLLKKENLTGKAKDGLKILGNGKLEIALTIKAHAFSKGAIKKIEAAGGKAEVVD